MSPSADSLEGAAASIVRHFPDSLLRFDRDGRVLFASGPVEETVGVPPERLLGRLVREVAPTPEAFAELDAARERVLAAGTAVTIELRRVAAEGMRSFEFRLLPEHGVDGRIETVLAIGREITTMRQATSALQASEARYRALVQATSHAVWRTGPDGMVDVASADWIAFTGQPSQPARRTGTEWLAAVHADDRARIWEAWMAAVHAERVFGAELRVHRRDGEWRTVAARAAPVRDDEGRITEWIGTISDVTDREEARAALEAERARLVEAQHIARLGSWQWERGTGRMLASLEVRRTFGVDGETVMDPADALERVLVPEERPRFAARRAEVDRDRPAVTGDRWRIVAPDGRELVVQTRTTWEYDADGRRVAGSGTYQDVTEQVTVEVRLERQQALFEESQRLAHVGSWELDLATDEVTWSDEMYRIAGLTPDDGPMTRARIASLIVAEDLGYVRARLAEGIASGREVEYEHRIVCPDGQLRTVVTRGRMVRGPNGSTARVVGSSQDVTEHRALEHQVRQTQKMEALGLLAGSVAHDFNNLLSAILGGAELARLEARDGTPLAADLDDIRKAAGRAAELTRQLLAFSRKQIWRPRVMDLRETARHAERLLRHLLPDGVTLDVALGPTPCVVRADAGQLEQVVMNLVVNARDAIVEARAAAGGETRPADVVRIEVGLRTVAPGSAYRAARDGAPLPAGVYATLVVRDTGAGMDAETREHLFEPFFTTKPAGKGTGLGLPTVYGIVAQHEGAIQAHSAPRAGATFTVLLPVTEAPLDASELAAALPPRGTETILLVEDESMVRAVAARILERSGYRVIASRDGADAMLAWRERGPTIDAVVTDLRMPDMDGRALAVALRAERPDLPLVLMSGYATGRGTDGASLLDNEIFLEKPFTAETLLVQVRTALDRRAG